MKFYNKQDVQDITGLGNTASYDLIKKLNKLLVKEYPGTITLEAKVPKWYFDLKIMPEMKGDEKNEKENKY